MLLYERILLGIYLVILIYFSIVDYKARAVPEMGIMMFGIFGMISGISVHIYKKEAKWSCLVVEIIFVLLFFVIGKVTKESFGYGDCWGILGVSTIFPLLDFINMLCVSFFLLAVFGIFWFGFQNMKGKEKLEQMTLPFYPFLALGFLSNFIGKM